MLDTTIDNLSNEILKTAGIISATGRTLGAATLGAGLGALKGTSANEANPNATADEKAGNVLGGAIGGALTGGAIGGPGVGAVKFAGKKIANKASHLGNKTLNLFKKSEMEIPRDVIDKSHDDESVRESPNESEKRKMINSISEEDERKQHYKSQIEKEASQIMKQFFKEAGYLKDIECEECGYSGTPNSEDGRCPTCGAIGGIKPTTLPNGNNDEPLNRELMEGELQRAAEQSMRESILYN